MKVFITGISGFIGKNILEYFPKDIEILGVYNSSTSIKKFVKNKNLSNVKLYKCDLSDNDQVIEMFKKIGNYFDYCIYLSSNVDISKSISDPGLDLKFNSLALINVLMNSSYDKFIYLSTSGVYDGIKGKVNINTKLDPINPYCISKLASEQYIKFFRSIGRINNYNILRFGGAYGRYSENKFITKLIKKIYLEGKNTVEIYGDGKSIIKTMYVKDTILCLLRCLMSKNRDVVCNLGQYSYSLNELIFKISKILDKKIKIEYLPKDKNQKYVYFEEMNDFNKIFNHKYSYDINSGIIEFAKNLV